MMGPVDLHKTLLPPSPHRQGLVLVRWFPATLHGRLTQGRHRVRQPIHPLQQLVGGRAPVGLDQRPCHLAAVRIAVPVHPPVELGRQDWVCRLPRRHAAQLVSHRALELGTGPADATRLAGPFHPRRQPVRALRSPGGPHRECRPQLVAIEPARPLVSRGQVGAATGIPVSPCKGREEEWNAHGTTAETVFAVFCLLMSVFLGQQLLNRVEKTEWRRNLRMVSEARNTLPQGREVQAKGGRQPEKVQEGGLRVDCCALFLTRGPSTFPA
eukprot:scaffold9484_cov124-Isochrysis_galbana.AAC.25